MEHPLIGKLDDLTIDQLSEKINDLNNKLSFVTKTGNGHLAGQIRMALESYQAKYKEKLEETYKKQRSDINFDDKIKIR